MMEAGGERSWRLGLHWSDRHACLSVFRDGAVEIIPDFYGNRVIPMYVAYFHDWRMLFGQRARTYAKDHPQMCLCDFGELISLTFEKHDNSSLRAEWGRYEAAARAISRAQGDDELSFETGDEPPSLEPADVALTFLRELRGYAERYLRRHSRWFSCRTTIVVPSHFEDITVRCIEVIAQRAGFIVSQIIREPLAAAVAFGLNVQCRPRRSRRRDYCDLEDERKCVIFQFGSRVSEATVLKVREGVITQVCSARDDDLGADCFTKAIANHVAFEFLKDKKTEIRSAKAKGQLWVRADLARRQLMRSQTSRIAIYDDGIEYVCVIQRSTFETLNTRNYGRCLALLRQALQDADLKKDEVDQLIVMGQEARMPKFQRLLHSYLSSKSLNITIAPDQLVDLALASHNTFTLPLTPMVLEKVWSPPSTRSPFVGFDYNWLNRISKGGDEAASLPRTPRSTSSRTTTATTRPVVSPLPPSSSYRGGTELDSSSSKTNTHDKYASLASAVGEIAAYGAAIQTAAKLGDCAVSVIPVGTVPMSIGVCEELGYVFDCFIARGTPIPCSTSKVVRRKADSEGRVRLAVYECERKFVAFGQQIAVVEIQRAPPLTVAEITLKFSVNEDGDLFVSTDVLNQHNHTSLGIPKSSRLTRKQANEMIEDSKLHQADDNLRWERVQAERNRLRAQKECQSCFNTILTEFQRCPATLKHELEYQTLGSLLREVSNWSKANPQAPADQYEIKTIALRKEARALSLLSAFSLLVEAGFTHILRNPFL